MSEIGRPEPPVVGKVTYNSIELKWGPYGKTFLERNISGRQKTAVHVHRSGINGSQSHFLIQERKVGLPTNTYETVYTGCAQRYVFEDLEPTTTYKYRLMVISDIGCSPSSDCVEVTTPSKPASVDDLHIAVDENDEEAVKYLCKG